jgi:hypothetical protein
MAHRGGSRSESQEVSTDVLETVCPPSRPTEDILASHQRIWKEWNWPNETTRELCLGLLNDPLNCIALTEYCRGLIRNRTAFISILDTVPQRTARISQWLTSDILISGSAAAAVRHLIARDLNSVSWESVYWFFRDIARVTPVSRLPVATRLKIRSRLMIFFVIYLGLLAWYPTFLIIRWQNEIGQNPLLPLWQQWLPALLSWLAVIFLGYGSIWFLCLPLRNVDPDNL